MSIYRPGGLELTEYALKTAGINAESRILDIGCGDGTVDQFIKECFHSSIIAVDNNSNFVEEAKSKGIDAKLASASMLPFESRTFDIVLMECVFSILNSQEEAIHEAYCMLKKGGCLVITDVYARSPDMDRYHSEYISAMKLWRKPREHKDCESSVNLPSPYCQDGAVVMEGLSGLLDELEMTPVLFEDRTDDLKAFLAQKIMDYGSLKKYAESDEGKKSCPCNCKSAGYFLLIVRK